LVDDGYSSDDVAIEMDLLTAEIADTQAARARQAAADAAPATVGVSLAQLERGVRAGTPRSRTTARGPSRSGSRDDVDTLTRIIGDEALTSQAARARRAELASTLETKNLALGPLEDQVRAASSRSTTITRDARRRRRRPRRRGAARRPARGQPRRDRSLDDEQHGVAISLAGSRSR
jgi:hypothetical protein